MGIAIVSFSIGLAVYAMLRLPRWLFLSVNRQSLWRIRDRIWDARQAGAVPDDETTQSVIELAEAAIIALPHFSPAMLHRMHKAPSTGRVPDPRWPNAGSDPMIRSEFQSLTNIVVRSLFTTSWHGVFILIMGVVGAGVMKVRQSVHITNGFSVRVASDFEMGPTDVMVVARHHGITADALLAGVG